MEPSSLVSKPPESTTVIVNQRTQSASNKDIPVSDSSSNTMNISGITHTITNTMTNTNTTSSTDNSIEPSPTLAELAPLTNTSMALVEFSSIFNPKENKEIIKEHIVNLLDNVNAQDVLLKVARALETVEKSSSNDDDITQSESENVSISAETTLENNISSASKHNSPNLSTGSSKVASPVFFPELSRRRRPNVFSEELTSELKVFREVAGLTQGKDEESNKNNDNNKKDLESHSWKQTNENEAANNVTSVVPSLKISSTPPSNIIKNKNINNNSNDNDNNDVSCNTPNVKPDAEHSLYRREENKVESCDAAIATTTTAYNSSTNEDEKYKHSTRSSLHEESVNMPTFTLLEKLRQSLPPIRKPRRQLTHHTNTEHTHSLHRNAAHVRTSIINTHSNIINEASLERPTPALTSHEESSISSSDKARQTKYSVINSLMNSLDLESSDANTMSNTIATLLESTADTNASSTLEDNSYDQTLSNDQDSKSDDGHDGRSLLNEKKDVHHDDDDERPNKLLKDEEHEGNDDQTLSNTLAAAAARKGGRRAAISAIPLAALGFDTTNNNGNTNSNTSFSSYPMGTTSPLSPAFVTNMATEAGTYTAKTANEERHLRQLMKKCHLFSDLESTELDFVVRVFNKEVHLAGSAILEQGNESTEKLYLIAEGTCEAIKNGKSLTALYPGSTFGELELMYKQAKCAATIRCVTNCTLYTLDDDSYHRIILQKTLKKREKFAALINKVPFLRGLPDYERMKVAEALSSAEYKQGEYIIHFGEKCTLMYFIMEGDVKVIGRNKGKKVDVCRLGVSDVVGELEFLFNHLAVADVVVTSRRLVTACITRKHFELILGPIHERLKEFIATNEIYSNYYVAEAADEKVRNELKRVGSLRRAARRINAAESPMATIAPAVSLESSAPPNKLSEELLESEEQSEKVSRVKSSVLESGNEQVKVAPEQSALGVKQALFVETQPSLATSQSIALQNKWIGNTGIDKNGELVLLAPAAIVASTSPTTTTNTSNNVNTFANSSITALEKMKNGDINLPVTVCHFPLRAIDRAEFIVVGLREDGLIFAWNETMAKLTNYSAEQAIGQNIYTYLLGEKEQKIMYDAITEARKYAGNVEEFFKLDTKEDVNEKTELEDINNNNNNNTKANSTASQSPELPLHNGTFDNILPNDLKSKLQKLRKRQHTYTLARQDGLTKATASLTAIPSLTSFGEDAPEVVLLIGEEIKQGPQKLMDSTQLLASQIQAIVMDSSQEYKERLHCIAEAIANFDATYRVLTVSTERLRVVEIRQLIGQVIMDFGSECVTKGISVCQRYEGIREERAFLDVELLPECLKRIMRLCVDHAHDCHLTIIATVTEKNSLEFLIINFNISAAELPNDVSEVLKRVNVNGDDDDEDSDANDDSETSSITTTSSDNTNSFLSDSESSNYNEEDNENSTHDENDERNAQFLLGHVSSSTSDDHHKHGKRHCKKKKSNTSENELKKQKKKAGKQNKKGKTELKNEEKADIMSEERSSTSNSHSQVFLTHTERHQLRMVRDAVEQQGGTLIIQQNKEDANIVFLIPYMPADDNERENASLEESLAESERSHVMAGSSNLYRGTSKSSLRGQQQQLRNKHNAKNSPQTGYDEPLNAFGIDDHNNNNEEEELENGKTAPSDVHDLYSHDNGTNNKKDTLRPMYNFTTLVAEDVPAHRNMLCTFLWERKHAVLPAYTFADIERLTGVADILFIDPFQSIMRNMTEQDPILLLREKTHQMAVVITGREFDERTITDYHTAGFITLKKPCTPVQAMQAIRKAEDKIAAFKQEAERIAMTRETLARNSRGAWRRGALLGKGTFGEVYEAVDVLTGGKMAVKEMRLDKKNVKLEQFVSEISTMCNLQHPNIIHYFYCEQSKEQNVIRVFMEYAAGGTLQTLLKKKGKLEFAEVQRLLRDVTEGLAYIHSQQYVHGDIKTANVLLSSDNKGKIGDFGTARTVQPGELIYVMQGSPLYMSPECMSAGDVDEEGEVIGYSFPSDIWSLGCVAMEMITNKPPFSHISNIKGPAGLTNYITSLIDIPDLSPLFGCRPCLIEFVSACLNPDANRRATAKDLLHFSVFSEEIDEVTNSALQALKRAQLLHILNKFVAFQEPTEEDIKYSQCVDRILNSRPAEHNNKNNNNNDNNNKNNDRDNDSEDNDHLITREMSDISRVFNKRLEQKCKEHEELEQEEIPRGKTRKVNDSKNDSDSDGVNLHDDMQQSSSFFESSSESDSSSLSSSSSSIKSKTRNAEGRTKAAVCDSISNKAPINSNTKMNDEKVQKELAGEEVTMTDDKETRERTPNPSRPSDNMSTLSSPTPVKRSKTLARNSGNNRSLNYSPSDSEEEEFFHSSSSSSFESSESSEDVKEEMEICRKNASIEDANTSTVPKTDLINTTQSNNDDVNEINSTTSKTPMETHEQNFIVNAEFNKTTWEKPVTDAVKQVEEEKESQKNLQRKAQVCAKETSFSSAMSHDSSKTEKTNISNLSAFAPSPATAASVAFQLPRPPPLPTRPQVKGTHEETNSFTNSYSSHHQQQKQIQQRHQSEESQSHRSGFTSSSSFAHNATLGLNNVSFYGLTKNMNVSSSQMNEVLASAASDFLKHLSAPAIQFMQNKRKTCRFPWQAKLTTPSASATFHCPPSPLSPAPQMTQAISSSTIDTTHNNTGTEVNADNLDLSLVSTLSNEDNVINTEALKHSPFAPAVDVSNKAVSTQNMVMEQREKEQNETAEVIAEDGTKNINENKEGEEEEVEETTVPLVFRGDHNTSQVFSPRIRPFIPNRTFFMVQERRHLPAFLQSNKMTSFTLTSHASRQLSNQSISTNFLYKQPSTITDIVHNKNNNNTVNTNKDVLTQNIDAEINIPNANVCQIDKYTPLQTDRDNATENNYTCNDDSLNVINTEKNNDGNIIEVLQHNKQQQELIRPNLHLTELLVTEHAEEVVPTDNNVNAWLESVTSECKLNEENVIEASPRLLNKPLLPCASYGELTPANTDLTAHPPNEHDLHNYDNKEDENEDGNNHNRINNNVDSIPAVEEALLEVFREMRELKKLLCTSATNISPSPSSTNIQATIKTDTSNLLSRQLHPSAPHQTEEEMHKEENQQFIRSAPCVRLKAASENNDRLRTMSAQELALHKNADSSVMKPGENETIDNVNIKESNTNTNDNVCKVADKLSQLTSMCHSRRHSTKQPRTMERRILNAFSGKVESKTESITAAVIAAGVHAQSEMNKEVTMNDADNDYVEEEQQIDKRTKKMKDDADDNDTNELHNIANETENIVSHNDNTTTTSNMYIEESKCAKAENDSSCRNKNRNDDTSSESNSFDVNDINVLDHNDGDRKEINHNVNEDAVKLIDSVMMRINSLILRASEDNTNTSIK